MKSTNASVTSHDTGKQSQSDSLGTLSKAALNETRVTQFIQRAHNLYGLGRYKEALENCEQAYETDAFRTDNLLLLGAIHFQLRNFSEAIFYNQQCIRVDPNFAEGYSNLGNALKELGDLKAAVQFYLKATKLKPRFSDAYNNLASAYMQLGQTQEAMETYQMALVLDPGLVDAHSNLGNLYKSNGDMEAAKKCYLEAIRIRPDFAVAWNNLAGIFKDEGNVSTAIAYYQEAIRLCPEFADAHSNLGNAFKEQGQVQDAIGCYQTALKLRPDFAIAHSNLASCHYDMGNLKEAIRCLKYAIQLEPNFPDAHNNLGNALKEDNRLDEAIESYRAALRLKPDHPHAYSNLGNALKDKGFVKEAIHCYVTAIRLMPTFAAAHSNLGSIFKEQGKLEQALAHYHEAISIDPLFADAYSNLGNTYKDMGRLEEAMKCYLTAVKIKPTFADAFSNLAAAYKDNGQLDLAINNYRKALELNPQQHEAIANLVHTLLFVCDWSSREEDFARLSQLIALQLTGSVSAVAQQQQQQQSSSVGSYNQNSSVFSEAAGSNGNGSVLPAVQPFHSLIYPLSLSELLLIARRYAARTKANVSLVDARSFNFRPKPKSIRLRIGYVSSDFGNHPLSQLMGSVFGLHDKSKFEITCYSLSPSDNSKYRKQIEKECEHFKDVSGLHFGDISNLIFQDNIHILINLNGYTKGSKNEIFALHPAPIQAHYLGFCGTMGADYIEYIIADSTVIPAQVRQFYQEKVVSLPHSYFVTDHKQSCKHCLKPPAQSADDNTFPSRSDFNIPEDKFVFCCFNQLYKIDPLIFDCWARILKRVNNSCLWLLRFPADGEANIRKEAIARGLTEDQIVFTDVVPRDMHIKRGYLADLFLDTVVYNAHTTACDILWSGTPMITLLSEEKMASRVGASILRAAGLDECICDTYVAYEELAVTLAEDSERLFAMRRHLESTRSSSAVFDTKRWVANLELGFQAMWKRHESGLPPADINVSDDDAAIPIKPKY